MQQPLAGVSAVRSTTVGRRTGVITFQDTQIVFLDTPGMLPGEFKYRGKLINRKSFFEVEECVQGCILEADCIVYLVDSTQPLYKHYIPQAMAHLLENDIPKLLVFNKMDRKQDSAKYIKMTEQYSLHKTVVLPSHVSSVVERSDIPVPLVFFSEDTADGVHFKEVMSVSAIRGTHLEFLWKEIRECAVCRPWEYSHHVISPDSLETVVTDLVRSEMLVKGISPWQFTQKFVGISENPENNTVIVEHLLFARNTIFKDEADRLDTSTYLSTLLSERYGKSVSLSLQMGYYRKRSTIVDGLDDSSLPEVEVFEGD